MLEAAAPTLLTSPHQFAGLRDHGYGAILCDPPWRFATWNKATAIKRHRSRGTNVSAAVHYQTMTTREISRLPVEDLAAPDCVLFLWCTWPMIEDALYVAQAWGFRFKTCAFDWLKADATQVDMFREDSKALMGMGYWTRANSEPCLLATKGSPIRRSAAVRQGIIEPRRQHSRKPDCVHGRIEQLVAGPRVELFARRRVAGWDAFGDQLETVT